MTRLRTSRWLILGLLFTCLALFMLAGCGEKKAKVEKQVVKKAQKKVTKKTPFSEVPTLEKYPEWLHTYYSSLKWQSHDRQNKMSREILLKSLQKGKENLLSNQKEGGNFNYQYDFAKREMDKSDNQVRQTGATWGVALIYQYQQEPQTKVALEKGLRFFFKNTKPGPEEGQLLVAYPGDASVSTGSVALVALSAIEYLRTEKAGNTTINPKFKAEIYEKLDGYIKFLTWMRLPDKHFSQSYSLLSKTKRGNYSPYFDGESMLCLIKAAKYLGERYGHLIPLLEESAIVMARDYTIGQWVTNHDSDKTKAFFQWSCMAFWEYQDAGWKNSETFGDYILTMAWWQMHIHHTLRRSRNTAYAYEGMTHAFKVARTRKHSAAIDDLGYTIDKGLFKLTSWQVGGPLADRNKFLVANPTDEKIAIGGVMNHRREAPLRIDVVQHQMHAVILATKYVYPEDHPSGFKVADLGQ
jgi:hypothetical protein